MSQKFIAYQEVHREISKLLYHNYEFMTEKGKRRLDEVEPA
jgi:hypothetical protein